MSENLKNILLVMSSGGFLVPPDEDVDKEELWSETWKRINRFLPNFFAELFPDEAKNPKGERKPKEAGGKEKENEKVVADGQTETETDANGTREKEGAE